MTTMSAAAVSRPDFLTFHTDADAIRARVDAARRVMEIATLASTAAAVRTAAAVALADMAAHGDDLTTVTHEYRKLAAAADLAAATYQQAIDELTEVRACVPLSVVA